MFHGYILFLSHHLEKKHYRHCNDLASRSKLSQDLLKPVFPIPIEITSLRKMALAGHILVLPKPE